MTFHTLTDTPDALGTEYLHQRVGVETLPDGSTVVDFAFSFDGSRITRSVAVYESPDGTFSHAAQEYGDSEFGCLSDASADAKECLS